MKILKILDFKNLWNDFWYCMEDGARTTEPVLDPEIVKILDEDPEGWEKHLNLLSKGKTGLKKYEKYTI